MALRDQLRPIETWSELTEKLVEADARAVADVALGIRSAAAAEYLLEYLKNYPEVPAVSVRDVHHVARHGREEQMPELLTFVRSVGDDNHQASLLLAVVQATQERGAKLSDEARKLSESQVGSLLAADQTESQTLGIALAGALQVKTAQAALMLLAKRRDLPESQRKSAASALVSIDPQNHVKLLSNLLVDPDEPPAIRDHAATLLAAVDQPDSRDELLQALPAAPARLQGTIAVGLAGNKQGAELLLQAVVAGKASARLLQHREVEFRLERYKLPELSERIAKLTADLLPENERLHQLIDQRRQAFAVAQPDLAAGANIFSKQCAICHQVANQGAKIGPQLDGIGVRGLDRLLEDLIDPNRNVDQAFRSTMLVLNNGQIISGRVLGEEGQIIILADQQGKELRVPQTDVEEQAISQLSLMPTNVVEQIPEAEFRDLLGYLLSLQAKPAGQ
jgi:putative heme-binding domain-containing protein